MTPAELAKELEGLAVKATQGNLSPRAGRARVETSIWSPNDARCVAQMVRTEDADLFVALVNNLPAIIAALRATDALIPLAQFGSAVMDQWPEGHIDGADMQEMLIDHGIIAAVEGGFNSAIHTDAHNYCPEEGDIWLMPTDAASRGCAVLSALPPPPTGDAT